MEQTCTNSKEETRKTQMEIKRDSFVWRLANCNVLKTEFCHPILDCNSKWHLSFRIQLLNDIKKAISYLYPCKPSVVSPLKVVSLSLDMFFSFTNFPTAIAQRNYHSIMVFICVGQRKLPKHTCFYNCHTTLGMA